MDDHVLTDSFGRRIRTLRLSLTDRCNFRCVYCMPSEGLAVLPSDRYLAVDQIVRFVDTVAGLGVDRVRLTGGEPLLRREVIEITRAIRAIDGVRDLSMTTNASLLTKYAEPLRDAGLDRLNISLDSLNADRFVEITRAKAYQSVREGIEVARGLGFPVKVNVVVLSGMPDAEILAFVRLAIRHEFDVRFLEFMPLCGSGWKSDRVYPIGDVRALVAAHFDLRELERADRPAQTFTINGGTARVGFIAPLSEPFCAKCSRMRLSADGKIRPCLFSNDEYPVRDLLTSHASDRELIANIRRAVRSKVWGSEFADQPFQGGETTKRRTRSSPLIRSIGG